MEETAMDQKHQPGEGIFKAILPEEIEMHIHWEASSCCRAIPRTFTGRSLVITSAK
jgi:hypothetical protein